MRNSIHFFRLVMLFILALTMNSCTDLDDNLFKNEPVGTINKEDLIEKDSELFNLIEQVTTTTNNPLEDIVCIDFVYPLNLLVYDSNLNPIGAVTITGDNNFSAFLDNIAVNQSISISYPMSTTLSNGTVFTVNNNTELKLAIESCSEEDIIQYCNGFCCGNGPGPGQGKAYWKIPYVENGNNKYTSGVFEMNTDGTLTFTFDNTSYLGTWNFVIINYLIHININLEGTSQVAQDWHFNRTVGLGINQMTIPSPDGMITLKREFEYVTPFQIGEAGPAGGKVFYDKGFYSQGWRYMEAAPNDTYFFEWGCSGSSISNANHSEIGRGFFNSAAIVNYHDGLLNYYTNPAVCNAANNGSVIAKKSLLSVNNNFRDWFLPSNDELQLLYQNLHAQGLGDFDNSVYWSSTEIDTNNAKVIDFSNGNSISNPKLPLVANVKARAIRTF